MVVAMPSLILLKAWHHLPELRNPSQAQLDAGNYPKARMTFQGLPITIENPRGSTRSGRSRAGKEWSVHMQHHYGYIRRTMGSDGDHYDCYVGPKADATHAFIVNTMKPPTFTAPDEQKAMLGFADEAEARAAFLAHYDNPGFLGSIAGMPMAEFKAKVMRTRDAGHDGLVKGVVLFLKADLFDAVPAHMRGSSFVRPYQRHHGHPVSMMMDGIKAKFPDAHHHDLYRHGLAVRAGRKPDPAGLFAHFHGFVEHSDAAPFAKPADVHGLAADYVGEVDDEAAAARATGRVASAGMVVDPDRQTEYLQRYLAAKD